MRTRSSRMEAKASLSIIFLLFFMPQFGKPRTCMRKVNCLWTREITRIWSYARCSFNSNSPALFKDTPGEAETYAHDQRKPRHRPAEFSASRCEALVVANSRELLQNGSSIIHLRVDKQNASAHSIDLFLVLRGRMTSSSNLSSRISKSED